MRRTPFLLILAYTLLQLAVNTSLAQNIVSHGIKNQSVTLAAAYNQQPGITEQAGQYNLDASLYGMGKIYAAYEGFSMPAVFTSKGIVFLQKKEKRLPHSEREKLEKQGVREEEIERMTVTNKNVVTMEWVNANPDPEVIFMERRSDYRTYGNLPSKAWDYDKVVFKNMYPGIDVVYSINKDAERGFEYSLYVRPGADIEAVKLRFGGDVKKIRKQGRHTISIKTGIDDIVHSGLSSFTTTGNDGYFTKDTASAIETEFEINNDEVSFHVNGNYDHHKMLVIDPFVSGAGSLTGASAGIAKDVDFDYAGNIYVTGGGDGNIHQLAKYNASGVLQWTFSGSLTNPSWTFGPYFGGWVVDKTNGNVYLGQGFNFSSGFIVVRINTNGLYDNYVTTGNPNFRENWKMIWNCNNGAPQIIVAGGGTNSDINLGIVAPPSVIPSASNLTGILNIAFQDMADMVIDPLTNSMYTIYASGSVPSLNNSIYKHDQPYSAATKVWSVPTGYGVLQEAANRPYLGAGFGLNENSANILAVNPSYLFYWDGKNLKAINKSTGIIVGTALTTANTALTQGGIIADACNNIYVGEVNGVIKVYQFNGSSFDDAAAPDISIPGFSGKAVYDLAYNETQKLLYASGNGFVAAVDVSAYCPNTVYTVSVTPNCITGSLTAAVTPAPPTGSTITYSIYKTGTLISSNTSGSFNGLSPAITYSIVATINQACSGSQATTDFVMPGPIIINTQANATCGSNSGQITASASGTVAPYSYSIDGTNFNTTGLFTSLAAGVYTVTAEDGNGCRSSTSVNIINTNGPAISFTQVNASCGNNTGSVTANASGSVAPYQYSINSGSTYQNSNLFAGLSAGQYILMVKDGNGCVNASAISITSSVSPVITVVPASATCGNNNGIINAFGTGGLSPYQYSINSNTYQAGNTFAGLTPGTYTVTVKDNNGCATSTSAIVSNTPAPTVTAVSTQSACANANGSITATGSGGVPPLQYSLNNGPSNPGNTFTALAAGTYTIKVTDLSGCTGTTNVVVSSASAGPTVGASATASSCSVNNGSITASASGGVTPYQYSINNTSYQAGNSFTGLGAGNYVAFVKDAVGCIGTFSIGVPNTTGPSLSLTATTTSCSSNNGSITATGTGGTGALTYSIDGISFQASGIFNSLATGTYTITVKDANGCTQKRSIVISNVSGLTLSVAAVSSACNSSTGSVTAVANGGIGLLEYSIDGTNYQSSNIFSNLNTGSYTVYVRDGNGCIVNQNTSVVTVTGPALTLISSNATCGTASGAVRANATGGTSPFTFNLDGGAYQSANAFINLTTGLHTINVKDATGCITAQTVTITNSGTGTAPSGITYTANNILACTGGTGRIKNLKGIPSGGGNNYQFSLDFGAFTSANKFTNVAAGTHVVTAMNDAGCIFRTIVTLGNGTIATAVLGTITPANCNTSNGSIVISGSGPNTPYHASIDNNGVWQTFFPPGANSTTFSGLAAGTHTITMADDADFVAGTPDIPGACLTSMFVVVPSTGGPGISTTQTNVSCFQNDGSITATASGGTGPYTYSINGGAYTGTNIFTALAAGTYAISVQDATGCTTGVSVTLTSPSVPLVTATVLNTSCNLSNGGITITATGGSGTLQYSIDGFNFQASSSFSNLATGAYTAYAKDVNGCYGKTTVSIGSTTLPRVTAFSVAASCNSSDGSITASGTSGTAPYQYSINGTLYQSNGSFNGLAAGNYTVYLKDARGCINISNVFIANAGAPTFSHTSTAATCSNPNGAATITASGGLSPYQYSKDGINYQVSNVITGLAAGTNNIFIKDNNGCINTRAIVINNAPGPQTLTATTVNAACGLSNGSITLTATGGTGALTYSKDGTIFQASSIFNLLPAGLYTMYVRDANLCIKTLTVTIENLTGPVINDATIAGTTCALSDGSIIAYASGGTGAHTYSINGINFQSGNIFTGIAAGNYNITVKDSRGCSSILSNVTVPAISYVSAAETHINASCGNANGSITITGLNGTAPYQYSSDGITYQPGNSFVSLQAGDYTVTAKDINGCIASTVVSMPVFIPIQLSATAQAACGSQGSISATASGGNAPLSYSIDGTNFISPGVFNNLSAGDYTVTVQDSGNCKDSITITVVTLPVNPRTWLGSNNNWFDPVNWCGGVPTVADDVMIPAGLLAYPFINTGTAQCKNISIQPTAAVTVTAGVMQIAGSINNQGILDAVTGSINLSGTVQQLIAGSTFYRHTIHQLIISNTSAEGVTISSAPGDTLKISRKLSFGYNQAVLNTGNQLTLLSCDSATAAIGKIEEHPDGSPMATINGTVIVERYYPSKRAWRLITAPVKADVEAPSINTAWQEAANPPSVTGIANPDPHPGYGTHITGPWPAPAAYSAMVTASGFDQSPQNNSSMKFYDGISNSYNPVINTLTTKVTDKQGYLLFVRGDRSYDISTTSNLMAPASTILRVRGNVNTGAVYIPADTGLQVIGNPYPSAIKFNDSMFAQNAGIMKNQSYWLWDPLRGSARNSPANVGGWIPVVYAGAGVYVSTYNPGASIAGLDSAHTFDINGLIQSGAAFMIDNKATATGNFQIHESSKEDGSNNYQFRPAGNNNSLSYIGTSVFRLDADNKPLYWADGTLLLLHSSYNNEPQWNEDVRKVYSSNENICTNHTGAMIAIEKRNSLNAGDTIRFFTARLKTGKYRFEIATNHFTPPVSAALFFQDSYTGLDSMIETTTAALIDVNITNDAASQSADRFRIVIKSITILPVTLLHFSGKENNGKASLTWEVNNQQDIASFVVEHSTDGILFTSLNTVTPTTATVYNTVDNNPAAGKNYYRIQIIEKNGRITYSAIVTINILQRNPEWSIQPNPIHNNIIQVNANGTPKGMYAYRLFNAAGQKLIEGKIVNSGNTTSFAIHPPQKLSAGIYQLQLINAAQKPIVLDVVIAE